MHIRLAVQTKNITSQIHFVMKVLQHHQLFFCFNQLKFAFLHKIKRMKKYISNISDKHLIQQRPPNWGNAKRHVIAVLLIAQVCRARNYVLHKRLGNCVHQAIP